MGVGGIGEISLLSVGDKWTALQIKSPVGGNMGVLGGSAELYSLEEFNLGGFPNHPMSSILSYQYYAEEDDERSDAIKKQEKTTLEVVRKKKQYYPIRLVTTPLHGKRKIELYRYDDEYNSYMPAKTSNPRPAR